MLNKLQAAGNRNTYQQAAQVKIALQSITTFLHVALICPAFACMLSWPHLPHLPGFLHIEQRRSTLYRLWSPFVVTVLVLIACACQLCTKVHTLWCQCVLWTLSIFNTDPKLQHLHSIRQRAACTLLKLHCLVQALKDVCATHGWLQKGVVNLNNTALLFTAVKTWCSGEYISDVVIRIQLLWTPVFGQWENFRS